MSEVVNGEPLSMLEKDCCPVLGHRDCEQIASHPCMTHFAFFSLAVACWDRLDSSLSLLHVCLKLPAQGASKEGQ